MKKSIYNYIIEYKGVYLIYNTFSSALIEMDSNTYKSFSSNSMNEKDLLLLRQQRIYVEDGIDEIALVNQRRHRYLDSNEETIYRIFTTTACNAKCFYCFEKGVKPEYMSIETAKRIVDFISENIRTRRLKINWFGGEPLLNKSVIGYITEALKKTNIETRYSMVTNGSLISENEIPLLKNTYEIKQIQITLDGFGDLYNSVKHYSNIPFAFDRIINNIRMLLDAEIFVTIRVHYVQALYDNIKQLICYLGEQFSQYRNVFVYLSPLWNVSSVSNSKIFSDEPVSNIDYSQYIDLMKLVVKLGLASEKNTLKLFPRFGQCMACKKDNYNILPNGDLLKCAEVMYEKIGNVYNIINEEKNSKWEFRNINNECSQCIFLPMCQGGCRASYFSDIERCFKNKPIIDDLIIWKYESQNETVNSSV